MIEFVIIMDEWDALIRDESYPALVVELKWNQNALTAVNQIKERKYPEYKQYRQLWKMLPD